MLPWDMFTFDKLEHYDTVNFLKGGVVYADAITTVSRKYAEEIQTAEYGNGMEDTFRSDSGDLFGILNGVDYTSGIQRPIHTSLLTTPQPSWTARRSAAAISCTPLASVASATRLP